MIEEIAIHDDLMTPHFMLTKKMLDMYDFQKTKVNVENMIEEYKTAKFKYLISSNMLEQISQVFHDNEAQFTNRRKDKLGDNVCEKENAYAIIKYFDDILESVNELLSKEEKTYYSMCLINNCSEQSAANILNMSIDGLRTIKQSCIIKIALAFHIEVLK